MIIPNLIENKKPKYYILESNKFTCFGSNTESFLNLLTGQNSKVTYILKKISTVTNFEIQTKLTSIIFTTQLIWQA